MKKREVAVLLVGFCSSITEQFPRLWGLSRIFSSVMNLQ